MIYEFEMKERGVAAQIMEMWGTNENGIDLQNVLIVDTVPSMVLVVLVEVHDRGSWG